MISSKSRTEKANSRKGFFLINWLIEKVPQFFDLTLQPAKKFHLKWLIGLLLLASIPLIITPLEIWQQGVIATLLIVIGILIVKIEHKRSDKKASELLHLFLVWLSIVTTLRYLYYRTSYTLNFDNWINGIACILLFGAELYAILTLFLAYFQTIKILDRESVDISHIPEKDWFNVDVYIPTYNEDVEIVRKTALAALALDYPEDKKRVYILDDGRAEKYKERREKLRQMCLELGCVHLTRDNNDHAKAGNINTAFRKTKGDLVLILDCDHIPAREFLKRTVGFFLDPKVSFVQTPHWFYNPDPFERNLLTKGKIPVGNELFYKVLQKGNDFWNAAFFCGSAAVIRKAHALQVGGIAVETVTEDCHTAFRLHSLGYKSVYYDKIMVAGLAPDIFSSYVGQQVRWARGMAQILRIENPVINPKLNLTIPQRICYFSATSHFFYGFPRLIYAIAPTLYLLFGINPIQGLGVETLVYALPHIALSLNANYIIYKEVRYSFWNEIFEFAMSYQAGIVTLMAMINPKMGKFNVTDKGISVTKRSFDWESSKVLVLVAAMVIISLISVPIWLLLRPEDQEAVLVNALWCVFNLTLLTGAILVAFEQPQLRRAHRLNRELTTIIYSEGQTWQGKTANISETGAQIILDTWPNLFDEVEIELIGDYGKRAFVKARIVRGVPINECQSVLAVDFIDVNSVQADDLTLVIFSDVEEWYSQKREEVDDPLGSLMFLATGLVRAFSDPKPEKGVQVRKKINAAAQLYWEGQLYLGQAVEMGLESIRLELKSSALPHLETWQQVKPPVGLLLTPAGEISAPTRLLALVKQVEIVPDDRNDRINNTVFLELTFPEPLRERQEHKLKKILHDAALTVSV
jgi:cellulose synthase (UDP-forming)